MTPIVNVQRFHKPLADAGIVPEHCRLLEMGIGVSGGFILRYEVFATAAQLAAIGVIFQSIGDELVEEERTRKATP
jgi:hypothetical protein